MIEGSSQKERMGEIYSSHHQMRGRYNYLFCHGTRIPYLKKWIGTGKKVLDLGCRDGMLTSGFALGNEVIGADIDADALKLAHERLGIETLWLDLNEEWPFKKGEFDVIVACEVMEHLFFPERILEQIGDALKPGGIFIGSVPNAFRIRNRWHFLWGKEFDSDPTHVRWFSYLKLKKMLQKHFASVEIVPIQGKVIPCLPVGPSLPYFLNRLFAKDLLWRAS